MLPESMPGENFLEKYTDHNDPVTVVDNKRSYGVRAAARHPIYENFRVKVSFFFFGSQLCNGRIKLVRKFFRYMYLI